VANHPFLHYRAPKDNSVFSFVHQLTTWHCPHLLLLLLTAGHAATNQYLLPTRPTAANPQQQRVMGQTNRQTDGRTPDSCIDPDLLILQAVQRTYDMHTATHTFACRLVNGQFLQNLSCSLERVSNVNISVWPDAFPDTN